jgi:autotransporter-associated beta strand protein
VPDLSNVSAVVIGSGNTVTFNDAVAGITSPAETGAVSITSLSGGGSLTVTNGSLSGTSLSLAQFNTSADTTVTASTGLTVAPATGTTDTIAGVLAGAGTFSKNGAGTTVLSGTNTFAGATTVAAGTLSISADSNLGTAPSSATVGSLVFSGGSLSVTDTMTLATTRGVTLGTNVVTINVAAEKVLTYGGVMANASGVTATLTKAGAGTLTLTGANTYTGGTNINSGTLSVGSSGALAASGTISFGGGTLQYSASNTADYSARFSTAANQAYRIDTNGKLSI